MGNNSVFSVDEAITMLMCRLSDSTGFKVLEESEEFEKNYRAIGLRSALVFFEME